MAEADEAKVQNVDTNEAAPATKQQKIRAARRKFLRQALAVTSGIALSKTIPSSLLIAAPQQCAAGETLEKITEITSNGNKLQVVLRVVNDFRVVPTMQGQSMLRYYQGYNPADTKQSWPPKDRTAPGPGPTLRCKLGDDVQISFLNQVDITRYPQTAFTGDTGSTSGCDEARKLNPDGTVADRNWYPGTAGDTFPNCVHASSASNIHFHGTHVTPSTTGDNVLVNIWPSTKVPEKDVLAAFKELFDKCGNGRSPQKWEELPERWRNDQVGDLKAGKTDPNKRGLIGEYDKFANLPDRLKLWPKDAKAIEAGIWPQYFVGSYPYCFQIPKKESGLKMGQAPGTHWYHSHKHGSTAINMYNGLSGAMIIEDNSLTGYDGKLNDYYGSTQGVPNLDQVVLVFQQITVDPNLLAAKTQPPPQLVNGQLRPTIKMQRKQTQLWRMVNANVQASLKLQFNSCVSGDTPPQFKQTAQDGVQFSQDNYVKQPLSDNGKSPINMAPGNRVDLLVQAPDKEGLYVLGTTNSPLLYIQVNGSAPAWAKDFPNRDQFPKIPDFLADIKRSDINKPLRTVKYGWEKGRRTPFRNPAAPRYTIDNEQFKDGVVNQKITLDAVEEWKITNETSIAHPFHIHVNPFQIVEIYDPNNADPNKRHLKFDDPPGSGKDFIWWDNFAIPTAKADKDGVILDPNTGKAQDPGYFVMRSRFVDFTGLYVQHCHILMHEDRGMMQLVQVCKDPNSEECKKQAMLEHH